MFHYKLTNTVLMEFVFAMKMDVDYLPMAKSEALNQLEIRRECEHLQGESIYW